MGAFTLAGEPGLLMKTYNPEYKYTFKWKFESISKLPAGIVERSSEFSVDPQSKWHVELKKTESNYCLNLFRNADAKAKLHYNISILDCNNEVIYDTEGKYDIDTKESKYVLLPRKSSIGKIESAPNDQVLFTVFIKVLLLPHKTVDMNNISLASDLQQKQLETLSRDFNNLHDKTTDADVTLRVRGESMTAHKSILCARSSVFASMFQHEMAENEANVVLIEDISMPTMKALVAFMYSGLLVDYDFDTALEVYYAADKYSVMDLRDICGRSLISKLTLDIVSKVLNLADMHRDLVLRDKAMQYIAYHYREE